MGDGLQEPILLEGQGECFAPVGNGCNAVAHFVRSHRRFQDQIRANHGGHKAGRDPQKLTKGAEIILQELP